MKRYTSLGGLVIILALFSSLGMGNQAHAQVDAFTFFIPFQSDDMAEQVAQGRSDFGAFINADIEVTISIAILSDQTIIYYDQWEDGLEPVLVVPDQVTTQVWGDGDTSNGIPPGFASDVLNSGSVVTLNNDVLVPRTNPPVQIYYDGGDKLTAVGGAIAVSMAAWPIREPPRPPEDGGQVRILYADAWELYTTSRWGLQYVVPVGVDLTPERGGFTIVGLNVQAAEDDTVIQVDLDSDGSFETTFTLNEGQQRHFPTGVVTGARVSSTRPVQVHIAATDPVRTYEMRGFTLVPVGQWTNDYLAPRTSDGDVWLYNPHNTPLLISVTSLSQTETISIAPGDTERYPPPPAPLLPRTGLRIFTLDGRPFTGVVALDADSAQDWGYSLLPIASLSTQALVGWGLGNYNRPPGPGNGGSGFESRLYVTALEETTINVDYNNDGVVDRTVDVEPLEEVDIVDPTDFNMTGAFIFTTNKVPFVAVWGQDQEAPPAEPSIDAGTTIVPLAALTIQKTFVLIGDSDCNSVITPGDLVRFNLKYTNNTAVDTPDAVVVQDTLPQELVYLPGSTRLNGQSLPDAVNGTPNLLDEGGLNVGILRARESGTIVFDTEISESAIAPVNNEAEVSVPAAIQIFDEARIKVPLQEQAFPVLTFQKTLVDPPVTRVTSGQALTFSLTITNSGSRAITRLPVQDRFNPALLTFLGAAPPPDLRASGVFTWSNLLTTTTGITNLLPGATISTTMRFVVNTLPSTATVIVNEVTIFGVRREGSALPIECTSFASLAASPAPPPTATPPDDDDDDDDGEETPVPAPTATVNPSVTPGATSPTTTPDGTPTETPEGTPPLNGTPGTGTPGPGTPGAPPSGGGSGTPGAAGPPGGVPGATSTIFPVNMLPETGTREAETGRAGANLAWGLVCLGVGSVLCLYGWKKRRNR